MGEGKNGQLDLFDEGRRVLPARLGHASISYRAASSILTKASGFLSDYDFTLNPYVGCSFGCNYCYAAFFSRTAELQNTWGQWVEVKQNAVQKLRRMRTPLAGKRIYMSSVTDPYQPIERHLRLVRELLEVLVPQEPRLVVQTRSPLVTRDLDLFAQLTHVRVNVTVTTDDEEVRTAFEPLCSPIQSRLDALTEVTSAGIPTSITLTPLLPVTDMSTFAERIRATGVQHVVVQPFHQGSSRFVAGTGDAAVQALADRGWGSVDHNAVVAELRRVLPIVEEGRDGFAPA